MFNYENIKHTGFKKRSLIILFIFLIFLAFAPRAVEVISGNYLFGFDQGRDYLSVRQIVVDRKLTLIGAEVGGRGGFFQGPGWYYLLAIPFILFKGDPYGAVILMLILGLSTVCFSFFLSKKMFDLKTAFFIGFLLAISPALIAQSRFFWAPFPISFLSVFYFYFLFHVFQKRSKYLIFLAITVGLMFHFEITTGVSLFLSTCVITLFLFFKEVTPPKIIFVSLASFALTLSPLILFDLRHNFLMTKGMMETLTMGRSHENFTLTSFAFFIMDHFAVFKGNFISAFPFGDKMYILYFFIILGGIVSFIRDKKYDIGKKIFICYLGLLPAFLFIIFLPYLQTVWGWWLLELFIAYAFLLGILLGHFWQKINTRVLIVFFLIVLFTGYIKDVERFYKNDFYDFGGTHKIKGKVEVLDYIFKDAGGEKFGLFIFSPPVYTYPYDYIIKWREEPIYNYMPVPKKNGLFYLLIEKDPAKPWSYNGWLETVIKTGNIIKTVELPSGFIVQKRLGGK